ncbi:MAG: hypothetical protein CMH56_15865 [Myxococcales bacterium]|nr:hypothetical protein [Myxococcales bacterium]
MERSVFNASYVSEVIEGLTATEWISENVLTDGFLGTQGFSLQFTREGISKVRARLPVLNQYLDLIEGSTGLLALRPSWHRWLKPTNDPKPNAFYLNFLEVPVGDCVNPHVDGTLSLKHGFSWSPPIFNTVMYLRVLPNSARFALRLPGKSPKYFEEQDGDVLYFRGDCIHSLDRLGEDFVDPGDHRTRLSLVCEQYYFSEEMLTKVPLMKLESKDAFKRVLEKRQQQGIEKDEVDILI